MKVVDKNERPNSYLKTTKNLAEFSTVKASMTTLGFDASVKGGRRQGSGGRGLAESRSTGHRRDHAVPQSQSCYCYIRYYHTYLCYF